MIELRSEQKSVDAEKNIFQGEVVEDKHQPPSGMNQYFFRLAHESIKLDEENKELEKENFCLYELIDVFILSLYEIIGILPKEVSLELNKACESYTAWKKGIKNASLIGLEYPVQE